jgi:uncharacterized membrane protein YqiK
LSLVHAAREIEAKGLAVVSQATSDYEAAQQKAQSLKVMANAEAEVERLRSQSAELQHETEARGRRAMNEAENAATPETAALRIRLATLAQIENVVRESAKPLEHISDIKIVHFDGLGTQGTGGTGDTGSANPSVSDQVMSSALKYRLQAPLVDSLLNSVGINPADSTDTLKP